jgi:hypothetical protein
MGNDPDTLEALFPLKSESVLPNVKSPSSRYLVL